MKNTIKNIASVTGIGLFSLFAIASVDDSPSANVTTGQVKETVAEYKVTAREVAQAFDENEVAANLKYENKIGEVTGTISSISKDFGSYNIMLNAIDFTGVVLRFDGDVAAQLAELKTGQRITAKGMCDGMSFNVEFESCVILAK